MHANRHNELDPDSRATGSDAEPAEAPPAGERRKVTDQLIELAADACELWHAPDGVAYATVHVDGHREIYAVQSRDFQGLLLRAYWHQSNEAPGSQAVKAALTNIEAQALHEGPEHDVYLRVAPRPGGGVVVDLGDPTWRAVEITAEGWRVVETPPVRMRRAPGMLSLPEPARGGSPDELAQHLGAASLPLIGGWLVAAFRPRGPYPVLILHGEQGSGKTLLSRKVRRLVDPSVSELRSQPREPRDLAVAARNGWVIGLDNLSGVSDRLSDALCRVSTGGGFATRKLYTDTEEVIMEATRPILLNGIDGVATRGDLLDRALVVELPRVDAYRPEAELWAEFEEAAPRLLGVSLDAVALAVAREAETSVEPDLRMADAARWVAAAEPRCPWPAGAWVAAIRGVRHEGHRVALEASPIGSTLLSIGRQGFVGTATELLTLVRDLDGPRARSRFWPQTPKAMANAVSRLAPALRAMGVPVQIGDPANGGTGLREPGTGRRLLTLGVPGDRHNGHGTRPSWMYLRDPETSDVSRPLPRDGRDGRDDDGAEDSPF